MRRLALLVVLLGGLAGCGADEPPRRNGDSPVRPGQNDGSTTPTGATGPAPTVVAALGDSITAGSPLWDPDPAFREDFAGRLGMEPDPRSQWEYWATERIGAAQVEFRNCGVFGERTDEIAARLDACLQDADRVVLQGGINDIAQGRPVADAAADLLELTRAAKRRASRVFLVEVLPWNNGGEAAAGPIRELNAAIRRIGKDERVPVFAWYSALSDPANPAAMRAELTIDGDHPSVAGYRKLAALVDVGL